MSRRTPSKGASDIAALLERFPTSEPDIGPSGAAVLAVLRPAPAEDDVEVLLIQRAVRSEDRASGQVGLPGGHVERADLTLQATALRETEEEVGIGPGDLLGPPRFVGRRAAPAFELEVGVFAAALAPDARTPVARDPTEVAAVFWLPRRALRDSVFVSTATGRGTREVEASVHEGHVVWGFTWKVLRSFFELDGPADDSVGPHRP